MNVRTLLFRRLAAASLVVAVAAPFAAPFAAPLAAQQPPTDSAVRAIITERVDSGLFAGIAVGLVSPDNHRRVIAYGPNAGVRPFDGNSVFEIGSITKTFTAAILADMVKKGQLSLDDPVAKYLPTGTVIPERNGRKIRLLDLATQSSGLPRMPTNFAPKDSENPYADYTAKQMFDFLGSYTLTRDIGAQYEYSNLGFGLLGQAVSFRAHQPYETLVLDRVIKPLGMRDTRITLTSSMQQRLAPGHTADGKVTKNWDLPAFAGAGAIRSTVNDMLTYIHANADSTSKPLGATLAMTHFERHAGPVPQLTLGLAWHRLKTPAGRTLVWHNGGTGGYRTFTGYNETTREGVVVLSNTARSVDDIGFHLLDPSVPLAPLRPPPKEPPQPTFAQRVQQVMDRPEFTHAIWGMEFYDLGAKRVVYGVNDQRLFVPGSTTKLVTNGTALELLGADRRFHTKVYRTGPVRRGTLEGDLVLVAVGDPNISGRENPDGTLTYTDDDHSYGGMPLPADPLTVLHQLAQQVAAKGITRVKGRVIVDASLFPEGDRELGTNIVISPMILNDNVVDIVVTPGVKAGDSATVKVQPQTAYLTVVNHLVTADSGTRPKVREAEDSTNRDFRVLTLTGHVPRTAPPRNRRWAVALPSRFAEIAFVETLNQAGVRAAARPAKDVIDFKALAARYADSTEVAEHVSPTLGAAVKVILKMSQNLHASTLPYLIKATLAPDDSTKTAYDLERAFLEKGGLDVNGAMQADGAGGDAYFSPAFITRYLEYCSTRPWAEILKGALPILGRDGTLADIQKQSPAAGHVFAKTGTYAGYDPLNRRLLVHGKGMAGYFTSKSGRQIAFALYLNNFALATGDPAAYAGQTLGEISALGWEYIP